MSAHPNLLTQGPQCRPNLAPLQRRATHLPHSALLERASRTCSAALAVGQGRNGRDSKRVGRPPRMLRPACSLPAPGGALLSPAPPPERLGFESPAGCGRKDRPLSPAWRGRAPADGAQCKSSVPVGSGNAPALPGSCWRPSGATRNSWGWWPRCGRARPPVWGGEPRVWEGLSEVGDPECVGSWAVLLHVGSSGILRFLAAAWH